MKKYTPIYTTEDGTPLIIRDQEFEAPSHRAAHATGLRSKLRECVTLNLFYTHLTLRLEDELFALADEIRVGNYPANTFTSHTLDWLKTSGLVSAFTPRAAAQPDGDTDRPLRQWQHAKTSTGKIPAIEIGIENASAPGPHRPTVKLKRFLPEDDIWERANHILGQWATQAPDDGSYARIEFAVVYSDGRVYEGCYLLTQELARDEEQSPNLAAEIRRGAQMFAARRRPDHLSEQAYRDLLSTFGRAWRERYTLLLDHYEIPESRPEAEAEAAPHTLLPPNLNDTTNTNAPLPA